MQEKNVVWIFVQNPMQMDLVQYKPPYDFWICIRISIQVINHLEIGLNLENGVLSYSHWINYSHNLPLFTNNLLHLPTFRIVWAFATWLNTWALIFWWFLFSLASLAGSQVVIKKSLNDIFFSFKMRIERKITSF